MISNRVVLDSLFGCDKNNFKVAALDISQSIIMLPVQDMACNDESFFTE